MQPTLRHPLQLGWIPYWNLHPLYQELRSTHGESVAFHSGHPIAVNRWLLDGTVGIAPSSSVCLLYNNVEMAIPAGIACSGPVRSVYWGCHREHQAFLDLVDARCAVIQPVIQAALSASANFDARDAAKRIVAALREHPVEGAAVPPLEYTANSATSKALSRSLECLLFGRARHADVTVTTRSALRPVELLIGDEALAKRPCFYATVDFAHLWTKLTGLPFVFAVWQSRGEFINGWRRKIFACAQRAEQKMHVDPACYLPHTLPQDTSHHAIDLADYWGRLRYRFGCAEIRGLLLFLCLLRELGLAQADVDQVHKLVRWNELGRAASL